MNKEITCQICNNILSSPYTLQCCNSSICQPCFKKTLQKDPKNVQKTKKSCPCCQKELDDSNAPIPNRLLSEYIESTKKTDKAMNLFCECCEKQTQYNALSVCVDCGNKSFCQECFVALHSIGKYQRHQKADISASSTPQNGNITKAPICSSHPNEKVEHICLKDFNLLCGKCSILHKRACKANTIVLLKDGYKELKDQLLANKEKLIHFSSTMMKEHESYERRLENLHLSYKNNKQDIQAQFRSLHEILDFKEKETLTTLENMFNKQKTACEKEIQALKENDSSINHINGIIDFSFSIQNLAFFENIKFLSKKVEQYINLIKRRKDINELLLPTLQIENIEDYKHLLYSINEQDPIEKPLMAAHRSKTPVRSNGVSEHSKRKHPSPLPRYNSFKLYDNRGDLASTDRDRSQNNVSLDTVQSETSIPAEEQPKKAVTKVLSPSSSEKSAVALKKLGAFEVLSKGNNDSSRNGRKSAGRSDTTTSSLELTLSTSNYIVDNRSLSLLGASNGCFKESANMLKGLSKTPRGGLFDKKKKSPLVPSSQMDSPYFNFESQMTRFEDSHHFAEIMKNPLIERTFTELVPTATSIFVAWVHLLEQTQVTYQVEYGIGAKVQGVEQFRTAYKGPENKCIILNLMPKTTYRLRVRAIIPRNIENEDLSPSRSNKNTDEIYGAWNNTISISTRDNQKIDVTSLGSHSKIIIKGRENYIEFDKSGIVTAHDSYVHGKTMWEIELKQQSAHQATDDSNSSIKFGVTNKVGKTFSVVGSLVNYGLQEGSINIKVILDMDNRSMVVCSPANPLGDVINNLPEGPLYPAFQNKTNKNSNYPLLMFVKFDISLDI